MPTSNNDELKADFLLEGLLAGARNVAGQTGETFFGAGFDSALTIVSRRPELFQPLLRAVNRHLDRNGEATKMRDRELDQVLVKIDGITVQ